MAELMAVRVRWKPRLEPCKQQVNMACSLARRAHLRCATVMAYSSTEFLANSPSNGMGAWLEIDSGRACARWEQRPLVLLPLTPILLFNVLPRECRATPPQVPCGPTALQVSLCRIACKACFPV